MGRRPLRRPPQAWCRLGAGPLGAASGRVGIRARPLGLIARPHETRSSMDQRRQCPAGVGHQLWPAGHRGDHQPDRRLVAGPPVLSGDPAGAQPVDPHRPHRHLLPRQFRALRRAAAHLRSRPERLRHRRGSFVAVLGALGIAIGLALQGTRPAASRAPCACSICSIARSTTTTAPASSSKLWGEIVRVHERVERNPRALRAVD